MTVTRPAFAHKLPPREPTIRELWQRAIDAEKHAAAMRDSDCEYHSEEMAALDALAEMWDAIERETGLSRDMIGRVM